MFLLVLLFLDVVFGITIYNNFFDLINIPFSESKCLGFISALINLVMDYLDLFQLFLNKDFHMINFHIHFIDLLSNL